MLGREILSASKRIYRGNIVFTGLRPYLNKVHLVQIDEAIGSAELFVVRPKEELVIPEFLLMYLLSDLTLTQTKWILTGSSYPRLNEEDFKRLSILLPKKPEQEHIVKKIEGMKHRVYIGEECNGIEDKTNLIIFEKLGISIPENYARDYFFKTGKDEKALCFSISFSDSMDRLNYHFFDPRQKLLEELTQQYSTTIIDQIVSVPIQRGTQPEYVDKGKVSVIKTVDLKDAYIDYDNCLRVSEEYFRMHPEAHVMKNDVLISSTGIISMGKVDVYDRNDPAMVDGHISILRLVEGYDPHFITYYLRSHLGKVQIEKWWTGSSGQIELQPTDLGKIIIPNNTERGVPLKKQEEIARRIAKAITPIIEFQKGQKQLLAPINEEFRKLLGIACHHKIQ
jgi:restriction endonuclease S subunit